jgi:hypothetical protein
MTSPFENPEDIIRRKEFEKTNIEKKYRKKVSEQDLIEQGLKAQGILNIDEFNKLKNAQNEKEKKNIQFENNTRENAA